MNMFEALSKDLNSVLYSHRKRIFISWNWQPDWGQSSKGGQQYLKFLIASHRHRSQGTLTHAPPTHASRRKINTPSHLPGATRIKPISLLMMRGSDGFSIALRHKTWPRPPTSNAEVTEFLLWGSACLTRFGDWSRAGGMNRLLLSTTLLLSFPSPALPRPSFSSASPPNNPLHNKISWLQAFPFSLQLCKGGNSKPETS